MPGEEIAPSAGSSLPAALETCIGMLPGTWRERAMEMALRFVAPGLAKRISNDLDVIRGRRIISDGMAHAVLAEMTADPAQVARARERLLSDTIDRQENLEQIVGKAADILQAEVKEAEEAPREGVSEDWRRKFTSFAEEISDPQIQDMWARILAGEFRKPGSFSYRTLRLLSELPPHVAQIFEKHSGSMLAGDCIITIEDEWREGSRYLEAKELLDWGLVQEGPSGSQRTISSPHKGILVIPEGPLVGVLEGDAAPDKYGIPMMLLTASGRELLKLLPPMDHRVVLRAILNKAAKDLPQVETVYIAHNSPTGVRPLEYIKGGPTFQRGGLGGFTVGGSAGGYRQPS